MFVLPWIRPRFNQALETYTRADGALYFEINSGKEDAIRFWKDLGFVENGVDEWGMKLFIKR